MKKRLLRLLFVFSNLGFLKFILFKIKFIFPGNLKSLYYDHTRFYFRIKSSDFEVFRQIFVNKQYQFTSEPEDKIEYIIDLGSNNGLSSAYFKLRYPAAKIVGVDPDHGNIEVARKNNKRFTDVYFEQYAIWHEVSDLKIYDTGKGSYSYNIIGVGSEIGSTKTITIAELMQKYEFPRIDILKIDIEGAELELFKYGNREWLRQVKHLFIECHDHKRKGCTEALFKAISSYSFDVGYRGETFIITFH